MKKWKVSLLSLLVMGSYICLMEPFMKAHPMAIILTIFSVAVGICLAVYHLFKKEYGVSLAGASYVAMMLLIGFSSQGLDVLTVIELFVDMGIAGIVALGFYGVDDQWGEQKK